MISVSQDICIGCGSCATLCPKIFELGDDGKSRVVSQEDVACAKNAAETCPVQAITVN